MNSAKIYFDADGNERTIYQMVKSEPEWAANRIQEGEKAIEQLQQERQAKQELLEALEKIAQHGKEAEKVCEMGFTTFEIANKLIEKHKEK
jgi:hypothetical protein